MTRFDPTQTDPMTLHLHRWGVVRNPKLIAIHGFGDNGSAFAKLGPTTLRQDFQLTAPDLPGFGQTPADPSRPATIPVYAEIILDLIDRISPDAPAGILAHSIGSAIAVEAARQRPERVAALMSIEGNLTEEDAFLTGQAAQFDDPEAFKTHFLAHIEEMVRGGTASPRYLESVQRADAKCLWRLGRDAVNRGKADTFAKNYFSLAELGVETCYIWNRENTSERTAQLIDAQVIDGEMMHLDLPGKDHWMFETSPDFTAGLVHEFFLGFGP